MKIKDLYENISTEDTFFHSLPPTYTMPELKNNDGYRQYRFMMALAAAGADNNGEIEFDPHSLWNEEQAVVCMYPEEEEIVRMANKLMNVQGVKTITTKSQESENINTRSPINGLTAKFD